MIVPAVVVGHRAGRTWLTTVETDGLAPVTSQDLEPPVVVGPDPLGAGYPPRGALGAGRG